MSEMLQWIAPVFVTAVTLVGLEEPIHLLNDAYSLERLSDGDSAWSYTTKSGIGSSSGWPDSLVDRLADLEGCGLEPTDVIHASLRPGAQLGTWAVTRHERDTTDQRWSCVEGVLATLSPLGIPVGIRQLSLLAQMDQVQAKEPPVSPGIAWLTCLQPFVRLSGLDDCRPSGARNVSRTTAGMPQDGEVWEQMVDLLSCTDPEPAMTRLEASWVDGALVSVRTRPEAPCVEERLWENASALRFDGGALVGPKPASHFTAIELEIDVPLGVQR